jgi:lysophospholipase L1-like esterase
MVVVDSAVFQGASMSRFARFVWLFLMAFVITVSQVGHAAEPEHWVGTWATSPVVAKNPTGKFGADGTDGTTLREIVHLSIGGPAVRVIFTNEFGVEPLTIGAAEVAVRTGGSDVLAASATPLTFGGHSSVIIPPGALVVSDAAPLKVAALSDLAVSLFLPDQPVTQLTLHGFANQTNYLVAGNVVAAENLTSPKEFKSWDFLKGVDVKADADSGAIVAFGDSITDGALSTRDANARWPDVLAKRLQADKKTAGLGVLNEGIGGNRVLHDVTGPSALARFDRDVLALSGVKYVVIMEAINDIGHAADPDPAKRYDVISADDLIAGYSQLVRRAHTHGIKVIGATLTPYVGAKYQSPEGEAMRQALNQWIRTSKELDGVIDFDKVTSDPANPGVFLPDYDSGDHLHPKDTGYKAMGESIDLKLFVSEPVKIPVAKPKK